jgi:large subunit ribosomal protein L22
MTGPKLNEGSFVAGERAGTKATAKYLRVSASKARIVLDLIRGLPVRQADEVLQFADRAVAADIRKVLASAVANAIHNDGQDPNELFVKACFADEGPTLKRFAARARGRGTRINKRTCHITVVVARLDDDRLEVVQAREERRTAGGRRRRVAAGSSTSRRERVERSRQRAASLKDGDTLADVADQVDEAQVDEAQVDEAQVDEAQVDEAQVDEIDAVEAETVETNETEAAAPEAAADETTADDEAADSDEETK